jgi:hypothetical protein
MAMLVLEVAAGAVLQASGVRGLTATVVAAGVFGATVIALLVHRWRRGSLAKHLREFVADRRAAAPVAGGTTALAEWNDDTLECYRHTYADRVRKCTRRLQRRGVIGSNEARRLNHPGSLDDIQWVAERLANAGE